MANERSEMAYPVRLTKASKRAHKIGKEWYQKALDYSKEGKDVAWCMAGVPPEFLVAFDIAGVWPENFGTVCAAYQTAVHFLEIAEKDGYSSELCSYERTMLGYIKELVDGGGEIPEAAPRGGMGRADMLLTSGLACDPRTKGFQALKRFFDVPFHVIDTPNPPPGSDYNDPRLKDSYINYYVQELHELIQFIENVTGKTYDDNRMRHIVENSLESGRLIYDITEMRKHVPSPLPSEDYFGFVHLQLFMLGEDFVLEFYRELKDEIKRNIKEGVSAIPQEDFRICTMGLPPWYCLGIFNYMEKIGIAPVMDLAYFIGKPPDVDTTDPLRALAEKAWKKIVDSRDFGGNEISPEPWGIPDASGSWPAGLLESWLEDYQLDGIVQFFTRSCRVTSFGGTHIRSVMAQKGVPVLTLEIDMADPRGWSDDRIKAELDMFREVLEKAKQRA